MTFKRKPIARKPSPLIGMVGPVRSTLTPSEAAVVAVPKGVACKAGKRAPTKEEAEWMARISNMGCMACRIDGSYPRPAEVHHMLSGGRRMGHLFTIPLCSGHHRDGTGAPGLVARHPWKKRFESKYGPEADLLRMTQRELLFSSTDLRHE